MGSRSSAAVAHVCMGSGGSEARAMWGIQALVCEFDVTLITAAHVGPAELQELNQFYSTDLQWGDFRVLEAPVVPGMRRNLGAAAIRGSLFQRFCRRVAPQFDVLVSAYNLCDFGVPAVHFIADFCWDRELQQRFDPMPPEAQRAIHRDGLLRRAYLGLAKRLARPSGRNLFGGEDLLVMNSQWTARLMEERYGVRGAPVVYPPVVGDFPAVPWEEKEHGFVCIGRIAHEKRVEMMIDVLRRVRGRGHNVHLHVIGPIDATPYGDYIQRLCAEHADWVIPEGRQSGAAKARLLATHRFGIHACDREAFGISVAELVKAGCIPFVPDSGGPPEIVGIPEVCYRDMDDAVEKIDRVLSSETVQHTLALRLNRQGDRFSVTQFQRQFCEVVQKFAAMRRSAKGER